MFVDDSIRASVTAAGELRQDVFLALRVREYSDFVFDGAKTLVLLPGRFYTGIAEEFTENLKSSPKLLFADVKYMAEELFREFIYKNSYKRIVIPFAELACSGEYGYSRGYIWAGEFKAEYREFIQTVCIFSKLYDNPGEFTALYNSKQTLLIGEDVIPAIKPLQVKDRRSLFYMLAAEAEKYAYKKTVIYFTTRSDASAFAGFMKKRGSSFSYFDGSVSPGYAKRSVEDFISGRTSVMLATKSFIPSSVFIKADRVIYAGVPYSVSHLIRCAACTDKLSVPVIFCEEDFIRSEKISASFSSFTGDENVIECRRRDLLHIKNILKNT